MRGRNALVVWMTPNVFTLNYRGEINELSVMEGRKQLTDIVVEVSFEFCRITVRAKNSYQREDTARRRSINVLSIQRVKHGLLAIDESRVVYQDVKCTTRNLRYGLSCSLQRDMNQQTNDQATKREAVSRTFSAL